MIGTGSIISMG